MNRKSILGIFLILIALSLTFGAVNAEEVPADDSSVNTILSVDENVAADELLADESGQTSQIESPAGDTNMDVAMLDVSNIWPVEMMEESGEIIVWSILIHNGGPDTAHNTMVKIDGTDNLIFENPFNSPTYMQVGDSPSFYDSEGIFDYHHLTWIIGDFPPDSYTELFVRSMKQGLGQYSIEVLVTSDTFDYDLSDNYAISSVGSSVNETNQETSANKTVSALDNASVTSLPAAGNPLVIALLALMAIGVGGIKRRL